MSAVMVQPQWDLVALCSGVALLVVLICTCKRKTRALPFKSLSAKGTHRSKPLPTEGALLDERKRDFSRIVVPLPKPGLLVVTPDVATPQPWTSTTERIHGDASKAVSDDVFEEFSKWFQEQTRGMSVSDNLPERVVSLVAVSEGFDFAMKNRFPAIFPQSKFVLVVGAQEVRVLWLAYATHEVRANLDATPWILKLLSPNLNTVNATSEGLDLEYALVYTKERDLDQYVKVRLVAALSKAALENDWSEVMASV